MGSLAVTGKVAAGNLSTNALAPPPLLLPHWQAPSRLISSPERYQHARQRGRLLAQVLPVRVTDLELRCTGMDDAFADIVRTGRFQCLQTLWLESNEDVTDQGVAALAKALDHAGTKGLPMLSTFSAFLRPPVTRVGVEALAHASSRTPPV